MSGIISNSFTASCRRRETMDRNVPSRRLQGWKEIADYLGTSTRSAQRWDACLQLPVHRDKRIRGATVWAQSDELDGWRLAHTDEIREDRDEQAAGKAPQPGGGAELLPQPSPVTPASELAPPASIEGMEVRLPASANENAPPRRERFLRRWALACSAAVVLLAGVGLSLWAIFGTHGVPGRARTAEIAGNTPATAYGLPVSGQRIVLAIRVGGDTASGEVLDGAMLTVALPSGRKIGIGPIARERGVDIVVFDIETRAGGAEASREIGRHHLSPGIPVVVGAVEGLSVELKGLSGKPTATLSSANARPKTCCITCSTFTVCAAAVGTSCGSCDSEK